MGEKLKYTNLISEGRKKAKPHDGLSVEKRVVYQDGWYAQLVDNIFRLLQECDIPLVYSGRVNKTTLRMKNCTVLPLTVTVKSKLCTEKFKFDKPCYNNSELVKALVDLEWRVRDMYDRWWGKKKMPCDKPLVHILENYSLLLYKSSRSLNMDQPFRFIEVDKSDGILYQTTKKHFTLSWLAKEIFFIVEKAWALQGRKLAELGMEFGLDSDGHFCLTDFTSMVISDNDNGDVNIYHQAAELSNRFGLPKQQVILLCRDEEYIRAVREYLSFYFGNTDVLRVIRTDKHEKWPPMLQKLVHEVPNSVVMYMHDPTKLHCTYNLKVPVIVHIVEPCPERDRFDSYLGSINSIFRFSGRTYTVTYQDLCVEKVDSITSQVIKILELNNPLLYAESMDLGVWRKRLP